MYIVTFKRPLCNSQEQINNNSEDVAVTRKRGRKRKTN